MKHLKRRTHEHGQHINGGTFGKQRTNKTTSTMDDPCENLTTSSETHRTTKGGKRSNGQYTNLTSTTGAKGHKPWEYTKSTNVMKQKNKTNKQKKHRTTQLKRTRHETKRAKQDGQVNEQDRKTTWELEETKSMGTKTNDQSINIQQ